METAWEAHPDHLRGLPGIDCHGILTQDSPELSVTGCQLCKGFYINIGDHSWPLAVAEMNFLGIFSL